jgi:hypothetical protein
VLKNIVIVIIVSITTNIITYKAICTCQACQSGHCATDYADLIYLRQFGHLNDRMPNRQWSAAYAQFLHTIYGYDNSSDTWKVVCLTATKFKPLIFFVVSFALSNVVKHFHDFV